MRCRSMKSMGRGQRERTSRNSSGCNRLHSEIGRPITINAPKLLRLQREYFLNCHLLSVADALRHASVSGGRGSTRPTDLPPAAFLPARGYRCRAYSGFSPQSRPCRSSDRSRGVAPRRRERAARAKEGSRRPRRRKRGCALREVRRTRQRSTSEEAARGQHRQPGGRRRRWGVPEKAVFKPDAGEQARAGAVGKASREIAMPAIDISNHSGDKQS